MEGYVQDVVDFIASNGWLAAPMMFVVSFAESLAFLSLLVPGWAIMVGAGALAGTGVLDPWPVVLGAVLGAIFGDSVSYWVGRQFGHRVAGVWPFRGHPELLDKGHRFFERWGGWSVALGRFFDDSAAHVDDKWSEVIMPKVDAVGRAILDRMGLDPGDQFHDLALLGGQPAPRLKRLAYQLRRA